MSKFSERIEKQIKRRAENEYEKCWKELEQVLNKYGLPRNILFIGFKGEFGKAEDKGGDRWSERVLETLQSRETDKFISELHRLESYFEAPEEFRY